jgi:hypothetical protein
MWLLTFNPFNNLCVYTHHSTEHMRSRIYARTHTPPPPPPTHTRTHKHKIKRANVARREVIRNQDDVPPEHLPCVEWNCRVAHGRTPRHLQTSLLKYVQRQRWDWG